MPPSIAFVVAGSLNTDLIAVGVDKLLHEGELSFGGEFKIGPGGKSRNIAQMIAILVGEGTVAMIGRTAKDPNNLWKSPVDALNDAGVNTDHIAISESGQPGVAFIPVTKHGQQQIYVMPGENMNFSTDDIDRALPVFDEAARNNGMLVLTMEMPYATLLYAMRQAKTRALRIIVDMGGMQRKTDYSALLREQPFVLKANRHETQQLTKVKVMDPSTGQQAAQIIQQYGIPNVLMTVGEYGAYLYTEHSTINIPAPLLHYAGQRDATGCGDQATAALCAALQEGLEPLAAVKRAVIAGTLQFQKVGIVPITKEELDAVAHA